MAERHAPPAKKPEPFELKPVEPRCSNCGYDLRTLANASGARCPECGARLPFDRLKFRRDRAAQRHYRRPKPIDAWWPVRWTFRQGMLVALLMGGTAFGIITTADPLGSGKFILGGVLVVEFIAAHIIITLSTKWRLRRYNEKQRERSGAATSRR